METFMTSTGAIKIWDATHVSGIARQDGSERNRCQSWVGSGDARRSASWGLAARFSDIGCLFLRAGWRHG
jgi:hypothetical protein